MRRLLPALLAALGLVALAVPAGASAKTHWLCRPGASNNPCEPSLRATLFTPGGKEKGVQNAKVARHPRIDCFYVYPTVSDEKKPEADFTVTSSERSIALFQASRFSQHCRVWAPMYRQITIQGLNSPGTVTQAMRERAYNDVRAAWRDYLRHHNHGRGVVFISHSQGSFVLRELIAKEIDRRPRVRRRLISALLIGGNVTVRKGRDAGGDFKHIRACRSARQLHCVVAYSSYSTTPPQNSLFGRVAGSASKRLEVLCVNPAALRGGSGALDTYTPTPKFPGLLGIVVNQFVGTLPSVKTLWVAYPHAYRARCSRAGGANVLHVAGVPGARPLLELPDATWGLHLGDMNLAMGNLTSLVNRQARAYLRRR